MKYILCIFLFSLLLSACDNSDELTPRIEDVFDTNIVSHFTINLRGTRRS